jgi:DNA-binding CsgD family transcriptional regulator
MSTRSRTKNIVNPQPFARALNEQGAPPLTRRQSEIMHWVTEGKRDREIAIILGLSPRTVEKHMCNILDNLHVETRTAAVKESRLSQTFDRELR